MRRFAIALFMALGTVALGYRLLSSGASATQPPVERGWSGAIELTGTTGLHPRPGRAPETHLADPVLDGGRSSNDHPEDEIEAHSAPTSAEAGILRDDFDRWMLEPQDHEETGDLLVYVDELLAAFQVRPNHRLASCGQTICRVQLSFDTLRDMRALASIPHQVGELRASAPEPVEDGVTIVMYWDRDDLGEGPF